MEFGLAKCAWLQLHGPADHVASFYLEAGPNRERLSITHTDSYVYLGCKFVQPHLPDRSHRPAGTGAETDPRRAEAQRERAAAARIAELTDAALATLRNRAVAAEGRFRAASDKVGAGGRVRANHFPAYVSTVLDQGVAAMDLTEEQCRRMDRHEFYLRGKAGCEEGSYRRFSERWAASRRNHILTYKADAHDSRRRRLAWKIPGTGVSEGFARGR
jgi:hypothetical protein